MTIQQGIAHNKLKALNRKRSDLALSFHRVSADHRNVAGMYVRASHSGADYILGCIAKVDAEIAKWKGVRYE